MIWLLRHGAAEDRADDDASRPLTPEGREQARAAGAALAALGARVETCVTSPKLRALETAELACQALGIEPVTAEALRGGDFDPCALGAGRDNTLLVGHEPDLSRALQLATGARAKLPKGGVAAFEDSTLKALLDPVQLALLAR